MVISVNTQYLYVINIFISSFLGNMVITSFNWKYNEWIICKHEKKSVKAYIMNVTLSNIWWKSIRIFIFHLFFCIPKFGFSENLSIPKSSVIPLPHFIRILSPQSIWAQMQFPIYINKVDDWCFIVWLEEKMWVRF